MALYLVQHGKSLPKSEDPQKGLSDIGFEETRRIAEVARGYQVPVKEIVRSGKYRALQTAEIFSDALTGGIASRPIERINPLDDVADFVRTVENDKNMMVVGHLPFMSRLTSFLVTGSVGETIFKFQNSGIVCLDFDSELKSWVIKWTLMPNIG